MKSEDISFCALLVFLAFIFTLVFIDGQDTPKIEPIVFERTELKINGERS